MIDSHFATEERQGAIINRTDTKEMLIKNRIVQTVQLPSSELSAEHQALGNWVLRQPTGSTVANGVQTCSQRADIIARLCTAYPERSHRIMHGR